MSELRQATFSAKREDRTLTRRARVPLLRNIPALWRAAGEERRAELLHAIYERIVVTRDGFARVQLRPHAFGFGLALALPETVSVDRVRARPAGFEPAT